MATRPSPTCCRGLTARACRCATLFSAPQCNTRGIVTCRLSQMLLPAEPLPPTPVDKMQLPPVSHEHIRRSPPSSRRRAPSARRASRATPPWPQVSGSCTATPRACLTCGRLSTLWPRMTRRRTRRRSAACSSAAPTCCCCGARSASTHLRLQRRRSNVLLLRCAADRDVSVRKTLFAAVPNCHATALVRALRPMGDCSAIHA